MFPKLPDDCREIIEGMKCVPMYHLYRFKGPLHTQILNEKEKWTENVEVIGRMELEGGRKG